MSSMQHALRKAGYGVQRRRPVRGDRPPSPKLPDAYFATDAEGRRYLQPNFVAKKTIEPLARQLGRFENPRLTKGQLRRFFNHCRQIERRLLIDGESWDQVDARFQALCSHAQYAESSRRIPATFKCFIDQNVQRVVADRDPRDAFLRGFLPHFEALVGFGSTHMGDH